MVEDAQTLVRAGFTLNQAKLYLTLVKMGRLNARATAKHSKVPRQAVYRVLDELLEMGFVEKIVDLPCEFEAIPIQSVLLSLLNQKAEEYAEIEKIARTLSKNPRRGSFHVKDPVFCIIPGRERLIQKIKTLQDDARTSVDLVTTASRLMQAINHLLENYKKTLKRGVKYRIVTDKPLRERVLLEAAGDMLANPNFQLRFIHDRPKAIMAIYDKKQAIVAVYPEANFQKSPVILTNHPSLIAMYQDHFELVWNAAQKYCVK
jgi:sugar-specific transcriptional regulator TrmB